MVKKKRDPSSPQNYFEVNYRYFDKSTRLGFLCMHLIMHHAQQLKRPIPALLSLFLPVLLRHTPICLFVADFSKHYSNSRKGFVLLFG